MNLDLNDWYSDPSAYAFQLTKRLEVDAQSFRDAHGFSDETGEDTATWCAPWS